MKKTIVIYLLPLLLSFNSVNAQEVLLSEDVSADTVVSRWGPNRLHYSHFYLNYGFCADDAENGAQTRFWQTRHWDIGWRYKLRVANFYAIGTDLSIGSQRFGLKQNSHKTLPDTVLHDVERLTLTPLRLGFYKRFNYGKRGNYIGNFVDVGIHGQWHIALRHFTQNETKTDDKEAQAGMVKVTKSRLNYYEDFGWGLHARIGFNRWVFSANYRMSQMFISRFELPELPRLSVGLQIGIHP